MKAGFAQIDITPTPGVKKIGWMQDLECRKLLDPLKALSAAFENNGEKTGFIQLDTLCIRWTQVNRIREKIESLYGFPGGNIMICASHNHAGPAVAEIYPVKRDEKYVEELEEKCVKCFGSALENMREAELGFGRINNFHVAHNRRSRMRDGTVKSQTYSSDPMFMCPEGPRDPEIAVLAARDSRSGNLLGCLVNYACHPTHHGGTDEISAGFPGVMRKNLIDMGCPAPLFLNGAYGNVITCDFERNISLTKEEAGTSLAEDVKKVLKNMQFTGDFTPGSTAQTLELPYRQITDDEYHGRVFGAQRYRSDQLYEAFIDTLAERIDKRRVQPAEVQVIRLGNIFFAGAPAEYFVEYQLRLKELCYPRYALTAGGANGMIGYVPTKEAFSRGGYETTLGPPSRMAPETGDIIAETAADLICGQKHY